MVRDHDIRAPSRVSRFCGYLGRWRRSLELIFESLGDQRVKELRELQQRLTEEEMAAVNRIRQGMEAKLSDERETNRCYLKVSVELYALAWAAETPGLIGLEQVTDIGVMASNGDFRSWRKVDPATAASDGLGAVRRLVEAPTLEAALKPASRSRAERYAGNPNESFGERKSRRSSGISKFPLVRQSTRSRMSMGASKFESESDGGSDAGSNPGSFVKASRKSERASKFAGSAGAPEVAFSVGGSSADGGRAAPPTDLGLGEDSEKPASDTSERPAAGGLLEGVVGLLSGRAPAEAAAGASKAHAHAHASFAPGTGSGEGLAALPEEKQASTALLAAALKTDDSRPISPLDAEIEALQEEGGGPHGYLTTRSLEPGHAHGHAAAAVFAGSGLLQKAHGHAHGPAGPRTTMRARQGFVEERHFIHRRLYVTFRTPHGHARYVLLDFGGFEAMHAWLVGLEAMLRQCTDAVECRNARASMMAWMRAVFTSVVESERKAQGRLKVNRWPSAIAIGARSLPTVLAAANLTVGREECAVLLRRVLEANREADGRKGKLGGAGASGGADGGAGEITSGQVSHLLRSRVSFVEFQQIMARVLVDERIGFLFQQHSTEARRLAKTIGEGGRMTLPEWLRFQRDVQSDPDDAANTAAFRAVATSAVAGEALGLTQLQFQWLLLDDNNSAIDAKRLARDGSDMSHPIGHYFVSCSHNTFLDGDQLASHSTPDMYRRVMLEGCRCIEIDIWDNTHDGEPDVTHGNTMCTKVKLRDVLEALAETAFLASEMPVLISVEMHCTQQQQVKCANLFRECFGEALLMPDQVEAMTSVEGGAPLTPQALANRILIKGKMSKRAQQQKRSSGADGGGSFSLGHRSTHKGEHGHSFMKHWRHSADTDSAEPAGIPEDEIVEDDEHGDTDDDEDDEEEGQPHGRNRRPSDAAADESVRDESDHAPQPKAGSPGGDAEKGGKPGERASARAEGSRSTKAHQRSSTASPTRGTAAERSTKHGHDRSTKHGSDFGKLGKKKKKGRYVDPEMEMVTTVRSKPLDSILGEEPLEWPLPITSISEKDISELASRAALDTGHTSKLQGSMQSRLARCYPRGTRIDSSNMLPLDSWRVGAHMVALNMQTNDLPVQLNRAFFARAGGGGFVLKPEAMRLPEPLWPPPRPTVRCVSLKLLSLHQLPARKESRPLYERHQQYVSKLNDSPEPPQAASVSSPALSVELFTVGGYCCTATESGDTPPASVKQAWGATPTRVRTAAVGGDGLHPHFDQTVHCLAAEPCETLLRLSVQDLTYSHGLTEGADAASRGHKSDVAYEAVVLDALRPGYRSLPLRSRSGCRVDMCCLYLHVSIKDVPLLTHEDDHMSA